MNTLKEASAFAIEQEFEYLPNENEIVIEHIFSNVFEHNIDKLKKASERHYVRFGRHRLRRSLVVACILILLMGMAMSVSAIRKPVLDFIVHYTNGMSKVEFITDEDSDAALKIEYQKPDTPNGYSISKETLNEFGCEIEYAGPSDKYIYYSQFDVETSGLSVDTENANATEKSINGCKVLETSKYETNTITWSNGINGFSLLGNCDMEILEMMAESNQ